MFQLISNILCPGLVQQEGPPNLDEILKRLFSTKESRMAAQAFKKPGQPGKPNKVQMISINLILIVLVLIWFLSGIVIIKPAQKAPVLRFGKYQETLNRGMHWVPSFISKVYVVDVSKVHTFGHQAEMLTKDENIVDVSVAVWYRIAVPKEFLFNVASPILSLREATASALRQVIGDTELDKILTTGRNKVMEDTKQQLITILKRYNTGIEITDVNLLPAKPPEAVTAAFDDAIKAREDEQRYINQAKAYSEKVEPIARGRAARIMRQANADAQKVILQSQAEVAPYLALLKAHKEQPDLTDLRLYFTTMTDVLSHTRKIISNGNGKMNMFIPPGYFNASRVGAGSHQPVQLNSDYQQADPTLGNNASNDGQNQPRSNYAFINK